MDTSLFMRMCVLVIFITSLLISGFYRNKARQEGSVIKRQEGWLVLMTRIVVTVVFLIVLLLNIFYPSAVSWAKFNLPRFIQIAALILGFLCIPFLWWVFLSLGKNISETILVKDEHELVTHGPYQWIRHPLYAGALMLLISASLVLADYVILGYAVIGILAFRLLVIPAEEEQLLETFGEDYKRYQSRTGAMLPWIH